MHGPRQDLFRLTFRVPSLCAEMVASGGADIGNIPIIELARQNLEMFPGRGEAARGPVPSILPIPKCPRREIPSRAADSSSRTSVALPRIILPRRYGADPVIQPHAPDLAGMLERADAAL